MTAHLFRLRPARLALTLAAVCSLALAAGFPLRLEADLTDNGRYTLSPRTREVLSALDSEVKVTWFKSRDLARVAANCGDIEGCLRDFSSASRGLFTYAIRDPASRDISVDIDSLGMQSRGDADDRYSGILIENGLASDVIPFVADRSRLEYDLLVRIIALRDKARPEIHVLFAAPSGSASCPYVVPWLEYSRFSVRELALPVTDIDPDIPLIVIGSSLVDPVTASAIDAFLDEGGDSAFFVSGVTVATSGNWNAEEKKGDPLLSLLSRRGAVIEGTIVLDESCWRMTLPSLDGSRYEAIDYPFWSRVTPRIAGKANENSLLNGIGTLQFFWPSEIRIDTGTNVGLRPVIDSGESSIAQERPFSTDPFGKQLDALRVRAGKARRHLAVASETRGRFVCVSDELFPGTMGDYAGADANLDFLVNCADWISGRDGLLSAKKVWPSDSAPTAGEIEAMTAYYGKVRMVMLALIPALLVISFTIVRLMRRRRRA